MSEKLNHTQGPWKKCNANNGNCPCGLIWDSTGEMVIATATSTCKEHESSNLSEGLTRGGKQFIANARLIAAAPEMLDNEINNSIFALEIIAELEKDSPNMALIMHHASNIAGGCKAIIEKATGLKIEEVIK